MGLFGAKIENAPISVSVTHYVINHPKSKWLKRQYIFAHSCTIGWGWASRNSSSLSVLVTAVPHVAAFNYEFC